MPLASRCLILAAAIVACAPTKAADSDTGAAAARVDLAAEEKAIRDLDVRRIRAISAKDTAAVAEFYATDALFMPPNAQSLGGRPGVLKGWRPSLEWPAGALRTNPTRVVVAWSGDLAYETGAYTMARVGGQGADTGKFVVVWKKQDGEWKITADIFNSDLPVRK